MRTKNAAVRAAASTVLAVVLALTTAFPVFAAPQVDDSATDAETFEEVPPLEHDFDTAGLTPADGARGAMAENEDQGAVSDDSTSSSAADAKEGDGYEGDYRIESKGRGYAISCDVNAVDMIRIDNRFFAHVGRLFPGDSVDGELRISNPLDFPQQLFLWLTVDGSGNDNDDRGAGKDDSNFDNALARVFLEVWQDGTCLYDGAMSDILGKDNRVSIGTYLPGEDGVVDLRAYMKEDAASAKEDTDDEDAEDKDVNAENIEDEDIDDEDAEDATDVIDGKDEELALGTLTWCFDAAPVSLQGPATEAATADDPAESVDRALVIAGILAVTFIIMLVIVFAKRRKATKHRE